MNEQIAWADSARCTGCGACVEVCPAGAIALADGKALVDEAKCTGCRVCIEACPEEAILPEPAPVVEGELMSVGPGTVLAELRPQAVRPARLMSRTLTVLAPALAFVGREIVPRVVASLLDAWDRRASPQTPSPDDSTPVGPARRVTTDPRRREGRQHRRRRGRGGQ